MKRKVANCFKVDDRGAVAATYALSLFALIAVAGIGFDYARLAGMDSELQNAADQAALAGVTQLDQKAGACARATNAAIALLNNQSRLANDGVLSEVQINGGSTITVAADACGPLLNSDGEPVITFYVDKEKDTVATTDAEAAFIEVIVDDRVARYAFTPIVGALNDELNAAAMAGLGSAICKVPPLMICSPDPLAPFNASVKKGWGIKATGGGTWAPGAFGFLEVGDGTKEDVIIALAYGDANLDCAPLDGTQAEPGNDTNFYRALNTRFDIYDFSKGSGTTLGPCYDGDCPPAPNVTKDLVNFNTTFNGANACKITYNNNGWGFPANRFFPKVRNTATETAETIHDADGVSAMGLGRDLCHYTSYGASCKSLNGLGAKDPTSRYGNGYWARGDYFQKYHTSLASVATTVASAGTNPATWTRYETYLWELGKLQVPNGAGGFTTVPGGAVPTANLAAGQRTTPVCQPAAVGGIDRRVLTVAVVKNCASLTPSTEIEVDEWVDVFLVEPVAIGINDKSESDNGRENNVIYVEVIGPASLGGKNGAGGPQEIRRDVPYLVQ